MCRTNSSTTTRGTSRRWSWQRTKLEDDVPAFGERPRIDLGVLAGRKGDHTGEHVAQQGHLAHRLGAQASRGLEGRDRLQIPAQPSTQGQQDGAHLGARPRQGEPAY